MYSGKILVLAVVVAVAVVFAVHALDFPGSVPDFVRASGGGVLLDVRPSFSTEAIYQRIAGYGEAGRANYAFRNTTVDVVLPLAVLPALLLSMLHATRRLSAGRVPTAILISLPITFVLFDFAENAIVLVLLASFPERMPVLAQVLPYVSLVKRVASLLAVAAPIVIFAALAWRKRLR